MIDLKHEYLSRQKTQLLGNWGIFLNILNIEAEAGVTGHDIRKTLYADPDLQKGFDFTMSALYIQVLRPLCWAGLLQQQKLDDRSRVAETVFVKTPLWKVALDLETDEFVKPATRH